MFDWGAKLNGYCSDMTCTVTFGQPDSQFLKIFSIVYDAQQKAIDAIRPGASSRSIDAIARNHIAEKGFKDFSGTVWAMAWALPCMNPVHQSG
ncbi:MAG: M24 family metallopeptidase [Desulfobacterales bacterium]